MKKYLHILTFFVTYLAALPLLAQCPTATNVELSSTDATCAGANDGTITVVLNDGTGPFGFQLYDLILDQYVTLAVTRTVSPANKVVFTKVPPSSYAVAVFKSGCNSPNPALVISNGLGIIVSEPAPIDLKVTSLKHIIGCFGDKTGSIEVTASGGNGSYEYSINGESFSKNSSFGNLAAGSYTLQVKDAKACTKEVTVEITQPAQLTANISEQIAPSCNGTATGSISVDAAGGIPGYTYSINNGTFDVKSTFSGLTDGNYVVKVKDSKGCIYTFPTITLAQPPVLSINLDNKTNITGCNGDATGEIAVSASGGIAGYSYAINGGEFGTNNTFAGLKAGEYTIVVKDAKGCTATLAKQTITEPAVLSIDITKRTDITGCFGDATGEIIVSAKGGTPGYEYSINGISFTTNATFNNLKAGDYAIEARDSKGCTVTLPVVKLSQPAVLEASVTSYNHPACFGNTNGSITLAANGGTPGYEYSLNGGAFTALTPTINNLKAGNYGIIIRDSKNCQVTLPAVTLTEPALLTVGLTNKTNIIGCNGDATGEIITEVEGGTSPYTFSINGSSFVSGTGTFSNLKAGTYNIQVKDANGCTATLVPQEITQPELLEITLIKATDINACFGEKTGSIEVNVKGGTAGYEYSINGSTFAAGTGNFDNLPAGTYTITARDSKACETTLSPVTLKQPTALSAVSTLIDVSCNGGSTGSISVTASGGTAGYTYSINGGTFASANTFNNLTKGEYTIEVKDAKNCTYTLPVISISQPLPLAINLDTKSHVTTCNGDATGSITVTFTGGTTPYSYSIDGTNFSASNTFSGLKKGTYTITVKDSNGCTAILANEEITQPDILTIDVTKKTDISTCFGDATGEIAVSASGGTAGYAYAINGGEFGTNNTFAGLKAGEYTIVVKDAKGCTATLAKQTITEPIQLTISLIKKTEPGCNNGNNGSITVSAAGGTSGYTYSINGSSFETTATFENLSAGITYTVQVKDAKGCSASLAPITFTNPTALLVSVSKTEPVCNGENNGSLTINASGGTAGYTYSINGGSYSTVNVFSNLAAGTYSVLVKDANNCTTTPVSVTLDQPSALMASVEDTKEISCNGASDGKIILAVSGGTSPYTYSINGGAFASGTGTLSNLPANKYTIVVKDAKGCSVTIKDVSIAEPAILTVGVSTKEDINVCAGITSGSVTVTASGGKASYTYAIDGGAFGANATFDNLKSGAHTISVKDGNNCTAQTAVNIETITGVLTAGFDKINVSCNGNTNGSVTVKNVTGGSGSYVYSKDGSNFQDSPVFTALSTGSYTITIKDKNSATCTTTLSVDVTQPDVLSALATTSHPSGCGINDGSITVNASGGTTPYTYSVNGSTFGSNNVLSNLAGGSYTVAVKDANNCTFTLPVITLNEPSSVTISLIDKKDISCSGVNDGLISVAGSGGTSPYTYSLDGVTFGSSNIFANLLKGDYNKITVKDTKGCTAVYPIVSIAEPLVLSAIVKETNNVGCNTSTSGSITIAVSGGVSPYTYSVNGGAFSSGTGTFSNLAVGEYTIQVKDAHACTVALPKVTLTSTTLIADVVKTAPSSCNAADGSLRVEASGGTSPYSYSLDGTTYTTNNVFAKLTDGRYSIYIRDSQGCMLTLQESLASTGGLTADVRAIDEKTCGANNGVILVSNVKGAAGPYTYFINGVVNPAGAGNNIFIGLAAGSYSIRVEAASGCFYSQTSKVSSACAPVCELTASIENPQEVSCHGGKNGSMQLVAAGGSGGYEYSIDNGATYQASAVFSGLSAGKYTITVRDKANPTCTTTVPHTVSEPALALTATVKGTAPATCTDNNGSISIETVNGGTAPYTYSIDNKTYVLESAFPGLPNGTYQVYVKDAKGCVYSEEISLAATPGITATIQKQDITCLGAKDGSIAITNVTGGRGNYQYSLNGSTFQDEPSFTALAKDSYTITIKDKTTGCTTTVPLSIIEPELLEIALTKSPIPVSGCFGDATGEIITTVEGGTSPYTYSVNGAEFVSGTGTFSNLKAGTYNIRVKDANGCTATLAPQTITQPELLEVIPVSSGTVSCNGGKDGSITVSARGGAGNYTYSIDGTTFVAAGTFSNLAAGEYTITVKDANNCTAIREGIKVSQPLAVSATINGTDPSACGINDGSIVVSNVGGTAPYSYSLNGTTYQNSSTFANLPAGNYVAYVKDAKGCIYITEAKALTAPGGIAATAISSKETACEAQDGTITVTASGASGAYSYYIDGDPNPNGINNNVFSSLLPDTYIIRVVASNNCEFTINEGVTVGTDCVQTCKLTATAEGTPTLCIGEFNGSVVITATGGQAPYTYSVDGGKTFVSTSTISGLKADTYTVIVRDAANCEVTTEPAIVSEPAMLEAELAKVNPSNCSASDGSLTVNTVSGGTSPYKYSLDGTTYQTENVFSNLFSGTYTLYIKDSKGCVLTRIESLSVAGGLQADVSPIAASGCEINDGIILVMVNTSTAPGPYMYFIKGGIYREETVNPLGEDNNMFTGLAAGTYSIRIEAANGCNYSEQTEVECKPVCNLAASIVAASVKQVSCKGGKDGSFELVAGGGSGSYEYSIDNGATYQASAVFSGLSAGKYTITVRDKANPTCTTTAPHTVSEPADNLNIDLAKAPTPVTGCYGNANGSITVIAIGGTEPYTYSVDGKIFTVSNVLDNLKAGLYNNIQVKDAKGCTTTLAAVTIYEPALIEAAIQEVKPSTCGAADGSISLIDVKGGSGSYQYSLDGSTFQDEATFSKLAEKDYVITIRDKNNPPCMVTRNWTLIGANSFTATAVATHETSCGANDGKITVSVPGDAASYQYFIDAGNGFTANLVGNEFTGLTPRSYRIKIVSADNCEFIIPNDVNVNAATCPPVCNLAASISNPIKPTCFGNADGKATLKVNGGTAPYTYSWNTTPVQTEATATGLAADIAYSVTVTDANGCIATASVKINQPAQVVAPSVSNNGPVCTGASINLTAETITDATYNWTGPNGYSSSVQNPVITNAGNAHKGTYSVIVTVGTCTSASASTTVEVNAVADATITTIAPMCANADAITLQAATAGGVWSGKGITDAAKGIFDAKVAGVGTHTIAYNVTVNTCTYTASREIVVTATSAAPVVTSEVIYCEGVDAAKLTASGTNLLWYTTATGGQGSVDAPKPSTTTAGTTTYYVSQNVKGCGESARAAITVTVKPATDPACICNFTAQASSRPVSCAGGSDGAALAVVTEGGSGQFLYRLLNSTEAPQTLNTFIATFNEQPKGPFEIEISDQVTSCRTIVNSIIGTDVTLIVPYERTNPSCTGNDGKLNFAPVGGGKGPYKISIDGGTTFITTQTGEAAFDKLTVGKYNVIVEDSKPCRTFMQIELVGNEPFAATFDAKQPQTCNDKGTVVVTPTGGVAPYIYSINNGDFINDADGIFELAANKYSIAVRDAKGCQVSFNTTLAPVNVVTAGEPTLTLPTCRGTKDGEIIWNGVNSETATYQFSIDGGTTWQNSSAFKGLGAGTYTIQVKNSAGCMYPFIYQLGDGNGISYTVSQLASSACGEATGKVEVTGISGGSGPYLYSLDGKSYQSSPVFDNLPATSYTMFVRDNTGSECGLVKQSFTISGVPAVSYKVDSVSIGCEGGNKGSIIVHAIKGGNRPYQVSIDNGSSWQFVQTDSIAFTDLAPKMYQLVIKYGVSCQTVVRNVNINSGGLPVEVATTAATCGAANGSATAILSDVTKKCFYSLNNTSFQESPVFLDLTAGKYTMYVRESANDICPKQTAFVVPGPDSLAYDLKKTDCFDIRVLNIRGGTAPYKVSLDGGKTFVSGYIFPQNPNYLANDLALGEYSIVVSDELGCSTVPVRVKIDNKITAKVTATLSLPDEPTSEIKIADIRGGNAPYEVSIDGVNWAVVKDKTLPIDTVFANQPMGKYTVYIRDANGCVKEYETEVKESKFTIPNIFTPNGDGVNDTFFIRNLPAGTFVTISNRWGKIIFSSDNYQNDWDGGSYPDGIYYFSVNIAGQGQYSGWVQIWR